MYYDVLVTETTIYNDGRKAKQNIETANSFSKKGSAYAYLDGIQEWNEEDIKMSKIEEQMRTEVAAHARDQYGIQLHDLRLKRLGLPATNVQSVFTQMQSFPRMLTRGMPGWMSGPFKRLRFSLAAARL